MEMKIFLLIYFNFLLNSGLIPRWLLEVSTIIITNVLVHFLKTQLPSQNELTGAYDYIATVSLSERKTQRISDDYHMWKRKSFPSKCVYLIKSIRMWWLLLLRDMITPFFAHSFFALCTCQSGDSVDRRHDVFSIVYITYGFKIWIFSLSLKLLLIHWVSWQL